jgi:ABC-type glycerol-3-phosphate transport system substrate-binding protein
MWVLTTTNAERQEVAIEFLNWLMDATRQNEYSAAIHMIPSQRSTLRLWQDEAYSEFVGELLDNALLPVPESTNARALQNAFSAVLLGRSTAEEATQNILEQVGG